MKRNPFEIVQWFEEEIADYTGADYAIATTSCTEALFLCCKLLGVQDREITIPHRTYLSVPQSIMQAGGHVKLREYSWSGIYELEPLKLYDAAKRLTSDMYIPGSLMCLSFHHKKPLKIGKGGMILTDDHNVVDRLKRMRYEGRTIGVPIQNDDIREMGWNMYMTPEQAARGLVLLHDYPSHTKDQIEVPGYPDLRTYSIFAEKS